MIGDKVHDHKRVRLKQRRGLHAIHTRNIEPIRQYALVNTTIPDSQNSLTVIVNEHQYNRVIATEKITSSLIMIWDMN
jgi:hypothetical protein